MVSRILVSLLFIQFNCVFPSYSCSHKHSIANVYDDGEDFFALDEEDEEKKEKIDYIMEDDFEELYNFNNFVSEADFISPLDLIFARYLPQPEAPENFLSKAVKYYDSGDYEKCLNYIKEYEGAFLRNRREPTNLERGIGLTYKAYCYLNLKKYNSAKNRFEDLINVMKSGSFTKECYFFTFFQYARCYAFLGEKDKCKSILKKLVDKNLAPTLADLQAKNFRVHMQPCFHYNECIESDRLIIDTLKVIAFGENVIHLKEQGELIPKCINCSSNEPSSHCRDWCTRICGTATIAASFIPNKAVQALVLYILVEFAIDCNNCCESGFGHEQCLKNLKWALMEIGNNEVI